MATSTTSTLSNQVIGVFNKIVDMSLAPAIRFAKDAVSVTKTPDQLTDAKPGSTVTWTRMDRIPTNVTALSETASGTAASLSDSQVTVTLNEYGNFVTTTEKLEELAFTDVKNLARNVVVENSARTVDELYMRAADTQTGADYNTYGPEGNRASKSVIVKTDVIDGDAVLDIDAKMRSMDAPKVQIEGAEAYIAHMHSDVIKDLRLDGDFREVKLYARPEEMIRGEVGMYEGVRIIENNSVPVDYKGGEEAQTATTVDGAHAAGATTLAVASASGIVAGNVIAITDASGDVWAHKVLSVATNDLTIGPAIRKNTFWYPGSGGLEVALSGSQAVEESAAVYTSYFLAQGAFAKAEAVAPNLRPSIDPSDAYLRQNRLAWYALWGVGIYDNACVHKLFTSSSRSANQ